MVKQQTKKKSPYKNKRNNIDIVIHKSNNKKRNTTAKASRISPNTYYYDPELAEHQGKIKIIVHSNDKNNKKQTFFKNGRYQVGGEEQLNNIQNTLQMNKMKYTEPLFRNNQENKKSIQMTHEENNPLPKNLLQEEDTLPENLTIQNKKQENETKSTTSQIGEDLANMIHYTTGKHPREHLQTFRDTLTTTLKNTASNIASIGKQTGGRRNKMRKSLKKQKNNKKHSKSKRYRRHQK